MKMGGQLHRCFRYLPKSNNFLDRFCKYFILATRGNGKQLGMPNRRFQIYCYLRQDFCDKAMSAVSADKSKS